jgi:hypothetical protein
MVGRVSGTATRPPGNLGIDAGEEDLERKFLESYRPGGCDDELMIARFLIWKG